LKNRFSSASVLVLSLLILPALVACGTAEPSADAATSCVPGSITISGSTAIQPLVAAAAKLYMSACSAASIDVQGGGSLVGLQQLSAGSVAIADSDVTADAIDMTGVVDHVVARQGFAIVTPKGVPIANLTQKQASDIFTCRVTNWKNVGGPDMPIAVILRPVTSGTRATFRTLVLNGQDECQSATTLTQDSSEAVRQAVEQTSGAVSVIGLAYLADPAAAQNLSAVKYKDVDASAARVNDGTYKIVADANMYTKGKVTGLTKAFLNFMLSDQVQRQLVPSLNFAPVE
jgi:phosphate transport system substrate-binding protein